MKKFCKKGHSARSRKRWLALFMSLCLLGTMIPISARAGMLSVTSLTDFDMTGQPSDAAVKTINLNAAVLRPAEADSKKWDTANGNQVYFGSYNSNPLAYRVLSSPNTQGSSESYLLLDCDTILEEMRFSINSNNKWTDSSCTVRNWLNGTDFYDASVFSTPEKTAIAETALAKQSKYTVGYFGISYEDYSAQNHVFCLSAAEADGLYANEDSRKKTGVGDNYWWLRSANSNFANGAGGMTSSGRSNSYVANEYCGVSPALNVMLSSVLFASVSGADKSSALASVSDSTAKQWKLTLLDSSKTVKVTDGQSVTRQGATVTVPYTYSGSDVTQISVMITDYPYTDRYDAQVLYYGALQDVNISNTSGTGTFHLPTDLSNKNYFAYIIAEDVNGDKETDYASTPVQITIPASSGSDPVKPDTPEAPVNGKGLGVSILADPTAPAATTDAWKGSYVYFGTYSSNPVKYRVLDRTSTDFGRNTMLLDCDSILWAGTNSDSQSSGFDASSNIWANSELKTYLNETFLTKNFTALEKAAIAESSKANASTTDGEGWTDSKYAALSGEQIFLLDAQEATNISYGYSNTDKEATNRKKTGGNACWWLRSGNSKYDDTAVYVQTSGLIHNNDRSSDYVGVSPALNVNLYSVLFSSVLSGTAGQPGAEYKLTLLDSHMTITPGTVTRDSGDEVTVTYTIGGTNGSNATQVSLMVLDKKYTAGNTNGAKLVAYEKLANAGSITGTFTLTRDMENGSYYYYIVAEDVNDGNVTDYASIPVQIPLVPPASKYTVTVTNGTLSGGSTTGQYAQGETVTITAGAAPSGQQFKEWTVVSGSITLASSTSKTTTFTMPAEAVSVKANYEAIPVTEYTITASAGANGNITPSGAVKVAAGGSKTFTISPSSGYEIDTLKVDGSEVPVTTSYTFSNVNTNHTIEVTFKQGSRTPNVPGVTAPSITTQPGNATVKEGETATFTIAASGENLTYQWKINRNDGNGWKDIPSANTASYTTSTVDKSCDGFQYKCVVSNSAGNVESNTATLTVQDAGGSDNPNTPNNTYQIINGANSSWTHDSDGNISIRGNGDFFKFTGVKVDGNLIDRSNYTAREGSTIITLKASYLNTLSAQTHTVEILWTDGSASTTFTIKADTSDNGNNNRNDHAPKTGDNTPIVWLFILVALSGTGLIFTGKKGRKNLETLRK